MRSYLLPVLFSLCIQLLIANACLALEKPQEGLAGVGITGHPGDTVDLSLPFTNAAGTSVQLKDYVQPNKALIIVPAYYSCPRLCGLTLDGTLALINSLSLSLGKDYQVLTVSFNKEESWKDALKKERLYRSRITAEGADPAAWNFLVGTEESISSLMGQLGFLYKKDGDEFAHTSAIFLITPEGTLSQYFAGIKFPRFDTRLALVEASEGHVGSLLDQVLLFCFRFDPTKGKYTWVALGTMRAGGLLTVLLLGGLITGLVMRDRK